jgi:hypothetical protein
MCWPRSATSSMCTPAGLIVVEVTNTQVPKQAAGSASRAALRRGAPPSAAPITASGEPPDCAVQPLRPERAGGGALAGRAGLLPLLSRRPGPVRRLLAVQDPGPGCGAYCCRAGMPALLPRAIPARRGLRGASAGAPCQRHRAGWPAVLPAAAAALPAVRPAAPHRPAWPRRRRPWPVRKLLAGTGRRLRCLRP